MNAPIAVAGGDADAPLFIDVNRTVTRGQFRGAVQRFAQSLAPAGILLNLCAGRDAFALTLVACGLRGRVCLLPPGAAMAAIGGVATAQAATEAAGEVADARLDLRWVLPPQIETGADAPGIPLLASGQVAVLSYTSGSTGVPQPHPKTWAMLQWSARQLAASLLFGLPRPKIVATVPPQHMFGLETTVLLPLFADAAVHVGRPFFPADIAVALAQVEAPRILVTTPVHLRALVAARPQLPPLALMVCATAGLPAELAAQAEHLFPAPLREIYGCTETGALAWRRTVDGEAWTPFQGVRIESTSGGARAHAPHLPTPVPLQDLITVAGDGRFVLNGRSSDLIKVAGKRISAGELSRQLLAIAGVEDAAVLAPAADDVTGRPAAVVVAPGLTEAQILDALAQRVDPVFLPRPLRRVEHLPRNAVGKLPREQLLALLHGSDGGARECRS